MYKVNPCVDNFTLNENRSCSVCNKVVMDLTEKSEEEVMELYNVNNGNLCGSVKSSYFNSSYYLHPFKRFAFSLLLVFGSSLFVIDARAQDSIQSIQAVIKPDIYAPEENYIISGKVTDENGESVFAAKVYIELDGVLYGAITDFEGEYKVAFPENKWITDSLIVKLKSIQYGSKETEIKKNKKDFYKVNFEVNEIDFEMVGVILINYPIISREPDAHRSTTITSKEIKRLPRK